MSAEIVTDATRKRVHVRVSGRVQGVYYRASTRREALSLGVSGWVRNTRDGAVELEIEGPPGKIADLLAWCHVGPPAARVERVETHELPLAQAGSDGIDGSRGKDSFEIRY